MTDQEREAIHERLARLEAEMKANTEVTTELKQGMGEVLDILNLGKSGMRVLGMMGSVARWTAGILTAAAAIWAALHNAGGGPK